MDKFREPGRPEHNFVLYSGTQYLCVLSMELASCHPSEAERFGVARTFLENLHPCCIVQGQGGQLQKNCGTVDQTQWQYSREDGNKGALTEQRGKWNRQLGKGYFIF